MWWKVRYLVLVVKRIREIVAWETKVFTISGTLHVRKANTVVANIELCVEATDKHITKDPQRPCWWRNIKANETTQTDGLAHLSNSQHIIFALQRERPSIDGKVDRWQRWNLAALDHVFSLQQWYGTKLGIKLLNQAGWSRDQRCASVCNGLASALAVFSSFNIIYVFGSGPHLNINHNFLFIDSTNIPIKKA